MDHDGLQSVTQSEVDLERELAAPTAQTVMEGRRVSAAPTQPVQDIVVDISVDTDGGQQTQVTSNPTSNQDHPTSQSDRAQNETRNPRSDFHNTQAVNRRSSNRRDSPILISDPPPPYPGPPTNPSFVPPHNSWQSCAPGYNSSARGQTPVVIFDRYGQQLHGTIVPVLPGEIQYSDPYPVSNRRHLPSVTTTVISQPPITQQTVRIRHGIGQPENDYLKLSFAMLVCCTLQANIPALLFILVALALSLKAREHNHHRRFRKARSFGCAAFLCNVLAMAEYILVIFGLCVIFIQLYVVQI